VTTEDGTGIVHIAPTFGADDKKVAAAFDVPGIMVLDKDGKKQAQVDPSKQSRSGAHESSDFNQRKYNNE
jgi:isoleucyl-tRNA synthetase